MKLALFSDVHGNPLALEAVLDDIRRRGGADSYWVLGDFVAIGFDPAAVLERIAALPHARIVRGNTDRYVLAGQGATGRGPLTLAAAQANPDLIPALVSIAQGLAWTYGYLAATGWIDWLAALPLEQRLLLPDGTRLLGVHAAPDGTRLLGVHAAPGWDDGPGMDLSTSDDMARLVAGCEADLVCVGHTHRAADRWVGDVHVVNVGSVSLPMTADRRASYAFLEANSDGYRLTVHRVAYDTEAVIRAIYAHHVFPDPAGRAAKFAQQPPDSTSDPSAPPPVS